jgi:hypothetical protein
MQPLAAAFVIARPKKRRKDEDTGDALVAGGATSVATLSAPALMTICKARKRLCEKSIHTPPPP